MTRAFTQLNFWTPNYEDYRNPKSILTANQERAKQKGPVTPPDIVTRPQGFVLKGKGPFHIPEGSLETTPLQNTYPKQPRLNPKRTGRL